MARLGSAPPPPPPRRSPLPPPAAPVPALAEVQLQDQIRGADGKPVSAIRFARSPGLGELIGYLPECQPDQVQDAIQRLLMDPAWLVHVLTRCAGLPQSSAEQVSLRDWPAVMTAVAGFFGGSPETGG